MAMITGIRAPIPLTEAPRAPRPVETQATPGEKPGKPTPVAAPLRTDAIRQGEEKTGPDNLPFQAVQVTATAAAEAAKAAYIRARIAAGLNPLPLP